jgi:hypothetical protein
MKVSKEFFFTDLQLVFELIIYIITIIFVLLYILFSIFPFMYSLFLSVSVDTVG